jgi:hypothetical protein
MRKFTVSLEYDLDNPNAKPFEVKAANLQVSPDWVLFYGGYEYDASTIVAAFPKTRVISIVSATD